jgi:hypothetical protein
MWRPRIDRCQLIRHAFRATNPQKFTRSHNSSITIRSSSQHPVVQNGLSALNNAVINRRITGEWSGLVGEQLEA